MTEKKAQVVFKMGIIVSAVTILISCSQGLKLSPFSRGKSLSQQKRTNICEGNPCPDDRPFLCKSSTMCVKWTVVCDGKNDCPDGFDENSASCGLAHSVTELQKSLSLTPENAENLRTALMSVNESEERPLIRMGMSENSWPDVKFFFENLLHTGFNFEKL